MKPRIVIASLAALAPLLYFAAGKLGGQPYPADLRDALNDMPRGAIEELRSNADGDTPVNIPEAKSVVFPAARKSVTPEDVAILEAVYVRVYMASVQMDWAGRLAGEDENTATVGRAAKLYREAITEFRSTPGDPPTKEAFETVLYVNGRILLVIEESARRLGYNSTDHKAFEKLFKEPYTGIMNGVAHMSTLAQARSDAAAISAVFVNGGGAKAGEFAEKSFSQEKGLAAPCGSENYADCAEKAGLQYVSENFYKVSALAVRRMQRAGIPEEAPWDPPRLHAKYYAKALLEVAKTPQIIGVRPPSRVAFVTLLTINRKVHHIYAVAAAEGKDHAAASVAISAVYQAVLDAGTLEKAESAAGKIAEDFATASVLGGVMSGPKR